MAPEVGRSQVQGNSFSLGCISNFASCSPAPFQSAANYRNTWRGVTERRKKTPEIRATRAGSFRRVSRRLVRWMIAIRDPRRRGGPVYRAALIVFSETPSLALAFAHANERGIEMVDAR